MQKKKKNAQDTSQILNTKIQEIRQLPHSTHLAGVARPGAQVVLVERAIVHHIGRAGGRGFQGREDRGRVVDPRLGLSRLKGAAAGGHEDVVDGHVAHETGA